ncbi:cation:proton antiporter [candidate division WOR-3 bacterium]|nr:cation:proton antiporter [candidate division WOR-3 bacterium]
MHFLAEHNLLIFLLQLVVLLLAARGAGELFRRLKQPALVGEILVGIIFGPTVMKRILPSVYDFFFLLGDVSKQPVTETVNQITQHTMFQTVSWLGVLFLLLVTGFEVEVDAVYKQRRSSLTIGFVGVLIPLAMGFGLAFLLPDRYMVDAQNKIVFALFLGTAVAISAIPIIAKVLHDLDILKSDVGLTIISAFTVNDILGWVAFTVVLGLATQQRLDWITSLRVFGGTAVFIAFSLTFGRKLVNKAVEWINRSPLPKPGSVLTFIVLLGGACGALTQLIGIHAAFGFLVAGVMAGASPAISERSREIISQMVYAVFVPLFFVSIGIQLDFLANFDWLLVTSITVVAIGGKFAGAWLGARLSAIKGRDATALGIAHIPGGAMEILIGVLALEFGLINEMVFEAVVVAAIVSSIMVGPLLSAVLRLRKAFNALGFLLTDAVVFELAGNTPQEAIGELCGSLSDHEGMPGAGRSCAAVNLREDIVGTGMEKGIAIPHARMPELARPVFTFGRSEGLDWNTSDGLPVKLVFLLLSPVEDKENLQVKILASIARVMSDERVRNEMLEAQSREKMLGVFTAALRRDRMRLASRKSQSSHP